MNKIFQPIMLVLLILPPACGMVNTLQPIPETHIITATPFLPIPDTPTPTLPIEINEIESKEELWEVLEITPVPPGTEVQLGEPVEYPASLDEAWQFIEEGRHGWVFPDCEPGELQKPFITWTMAQEAIAAQTLDRKHPYLSIKAEDIKRIVELGGAYFRGSGIVRVHEDEVFGAIIALGFKASFNGEVSLCSTEHNGKPTLGGPWIQEFLDWLANPKQLPEV